MLNDDLLRDIVKTAVREALLYQQNDHIAGRVTHMERICNNAAERVMVFIAIDRAMIDLQTEMKEALVPNEVSYVDESTIVKVMTALAGKNDLDFPQVLAAVNRLQDAGILFREEAEQKKRGPRTKPEPQQENPSVPTPTPAPRSTVPEGYTFNP